MEQVIQDNPSTQELSNRFQAWMGIPKRYKDLKFSDLKNIDQKINLAKQTIQDGKGLTLTGPRGTGKTHLATCLMRMAWALRGAYTDDMPIFISIPDMIQEIKESWRRDDSERAMSEGEWIKKVSTPFLVLLDDLGVGNHTDWSRGLLYNIIDKRYRDCKQTIVTTNLSSDEISAEIDDRIASRLAGEVVIKLDGKDWRVKR